MYTNRLFMTSKTTSHDTHKSVK